MAATLRSTRIVYGRFAMRAARLAAARRGQHGLQIMSFEQVAVRIAGGMRKIDRSGQRRHGLDASAFNSSMFFGWFFLERPCRIAVPIKC